MREMYGEFIALIRKKHYYSFTTHNERDGTVDFWTQDPLAQDVLDRIQYGTEIGVRYNPRDKLASSVWTRY